MNYARSQNRVDMGKLLLPKCVICASMHTEQVEQLCRTYKTSFLYWCVKKGTCMLVHCAKALPCTATHFALCVFYCPCGLASSCLAKLCLDPGRHQCHQALYAQGSCRERLVDP